LRSQRLKKQQLGLSRILVPCVVVCPDRYIDDVLNIFLRHLVVAETVHDITHIVRAGPKSLFTFPGPHEKGLRMLNLSE
jgi:hypothetical protein